MEELKQQLFSAEVELQYLKATIQEIELLVLEVKYGNALRELKKSVIELKSLISK